MVENYAEMKERKRKEAEARNKLRPKAPPRIVSAAEIRSRHAKMGRKYSVEEIKTLRKAMKLDLNQQELQRAEERARYEAHFAEAPALSDGPLPFANAPTPQPLVVPAGRDRDAYLAEERENDIARRVALEELTAGLGLDPATDRILRLLLAHSQIRGKNQGEPGWRIVDLAAVGADPFAILGLESPPAPAAGHNLTTAQKPQPSAIQPLEANRILAEGVERLRDLGVVRNAGLFVEVAIG
jgi:hypothetical protein